MVQFGIQTALGGYQSINELILPGGRLKEQRDICYSMLTDIPGVTCVKPQGALYIFPRIDIKKFNISNDEKMVYDLLLNKRILLVQGTGFNWHTPDHVRIVFLPNVEDLKYAINCFRDFLAAYSQ
jgi:alanine-synthesizing transaminase